MSSSTKRRDPKTKPSKRVRSGPFLVPSRVREKVSAVKACVDVTLTGAALKKLATECNTSENDFYFVGSMRGDPSIALQIQTLKKGSKTVHVTVEYRTGASAPYEKLAKAKMGRIVALLEAASKKVLRFASETKMINVDRLPTVPVAPLKNGRKLRIRALEFDVENEGASRSYVRVAFEEDGLRLTSTVRPRIRVQSLGAALEHAVAATELSQIEE